MRGWLPNRRRSCPVSGGGSPLVSTIGAMLPRMMLISVGGSGGRRRRRR